MNENLEQNNQKNNSFFIIIILLLVVIICILGYFLLIKKDKDDLNTNNEANQTTTNNTADVVEEEPKYINFTSAELPLDSTENFKLRIVNGNLITDKDIKINGISGTVQSFSYGSNCGGEFQIIALTTDGNVYTSSYDLNTTAAKTVKFDSLEFKKIDTNLNIVNITKHSETHWTTCGEPYLAVVLKNKEIRAVNKNSEIETFDYSIIKQSFNPIILYNDNTLSTFLNADEMENINKKEKIKYNNETLIADKVIKSESGVFYIISKKKLFKLEVEIAPNYEYKLSLVNDGEIKSESLKTNKGANYYDGYDQYMHKYYHGKEEVDNITFADGTTYKIENISSIYSNE